MAENRSISNAQAFAEYLSKLYRAYKALEAGAKLTAINADTYTNVSDVKDRAREQALSVEVSADWQQIWPLADPCALIDYRITLTVGGLALQMVGALDSGCFSEPETAKLQWRDWELPWTAYEPETDINDALLWFASLFFST